MEFTLAIDFEKSKIRLSTQVVHKIRSIFNKKKIQVGEANQRTVVKVLITDSGRKAQIHDEEVHTVTMLVVRESTRVDGGIVISYMEDILVRLQEAVDKLHLIEGNSTCFVRRN
jgi:hypothetical protein